MPRFEKRNQDDASMQFNRREKRKEKGVGGGTVVDELSNNII